MSNTIIIALLLVAGGILLRWIYLRNEKDKAELEQHFMDNYSKGRETEINDEDSKH
ncbi:hypothetical protein [Flavobacterium luminosum]|uniref:Uncharacterized protein n=1 Tax=Flavobacterium luminosum TaxID=2949086 RepID=A0ABT0TQC3_9FLAO|nr:hypothetical protein [Flavobacterium sp. HXWNR70]MCL9809689.1 hypothetical protein [Flavobacterium sp. HXWNR70]